MVNVLFLDNLINVFDILFNVFDFKFVNLYFFLLV